MRLQWFSTLSNEELQQLDRASLEILSDIGVQIHSPRALDILSHAGADIHPHNQLVRFPSKLVRQALQSTPSQVQLYRRDLTEAITLGSGRLAVASGHNATFIVDSDTHRRRGATKDDVGNFARVADYLADIDLVGIQAMPQDVKEQATLLHAFQAAVNHTAKHIFFSTESVEVVKAICQMARIASGRDNLADASPVTCQLSPTSPLMWEPGAIDGVIECAQAGIPLCFLPQPFSGVTAPITIAGLLAQHNAEVLSGLVLSQLVRPGAPVIWGSAWTTFESLGPCPASKPARFVAPNN